MLIRKIIYSFLSFSLVLIVAMAAQAYWLMYISKDISKIEQKSRILHSYIYSINANVLKTKTCLKDYLVANDSKHLIIHKKYVNKINDELSEIGRFIEANTELRHSVLLSKATHEYSDRVSKLLDKNRLFIAKISQYGLMAPALRIELYSEYIDKVQPEYAEFIEITSIATRNSFTAFFNSIEGENYAKSGMIVNYLMLTSALLFLMLCVFVFYIRSAVIIPIKQLITTTANAAKGNYEHSLSKYKMRNEIFSYIQSFNQLLDNLKSIDLSNKEYRWLREGENQLYQHLINTHTIDERNQAILSELCSRISASAAILYIYRESTESLHLASTYSAPKSKLNNSIYEIGESFVGEYALADEVKILDQLPDSYFMIESALGNTSAKQIAFIPIKFENKLFGIVEMATINEYAKSEIEYLNRASKIVATVFQFQHQI